MNIVFWGTPQLCIPLLESMQSQNQTPMAIVTNPDRPQGRKMGLTPTPVKSWALEQDIPIHTPEKVKKNVGLLDMLTDLKPDLFVVVAYGKILPEEIINLPTYGTINIHYSLLPKYRGASPVEAAILNGDTETGICIQQMVYEMDAGDILQEEVVEIAPDDTTLTLFPKLNNRAAEILPRVIENIFNGAVSPIPQDESLATYCTKIEKSQGELDLYGDAVLNYNTFRAYYLRPRTHFFQPLDSGDTIRCIIADASIEGDEFIVNRVIPAGDKEMSYSEFLRKYS